MADLKQKGGGAAFPVVWSDAEQVDPGMTLRDWFAGMAIQGTYAADDANSTMPTDAKANEAYLIADMMLKRREGADG